MRKYEIVNYGWDYPDYFVGVGTAFTDFDHVALGCGNDAAEAYRDAVEGVATALSEKEFEALRLPKRPRGIRSRDRVPAKAADNGAVWYVAIFYNT